MSNRVALSYRLEIGPISSVTVFGQHIVILNDLQLAVDLFDRKSSVFSDRPELVMCGQMYVLSLVGPYRRRTYNVQYIGVVGIGLWL